VKDLKPAVS